MEDLGHRYKSKYSYSFEDYLFSWIVYLFRHRSFPFGPRNSTTQDECLHHPSHLLSQDVHLEPLYLRNPLSLVHSGARQNPEWRLNLQWASDFIPRLYI